MLLLSNTHFSYLNFIGVEAKMSEQTTKHGQICTARYLNIHTFTHYKLKLLIARILVAVAVSGVAIFKHNILFESSIFSLIINTTFSVDALSLSLLRCQQQVALRPP